MLAVAQATQANALRQALELATVRYEAGLSSYLDLLDAPGSLFGAELPASRRAAVQLYKALGPELDSGITNAPTIGKLRGRRW